MSKNDVADLFKDVVNCNPVPSREFHANNHAVVGGKQLSTETQIFCECGNPFTFVCGDILSFSDTMPAYTRDLWTPIPQQTE